MITHSKANYKNGLFSLTILYINRHSMFCNLQALLITVYASTVFSKAVPFAIILLFAIVETLSNTLINRLLCVCVSVSV